MSGSPCRDIHPPPRPERLTIERLDNASLPPAPPGSPAPGEAFARWVALAGGAGLSPVAPGTAGSVVGVLFFLALGRLSLPLFTLTWGALLALSIWAADRAGHDLGVVDDPRIVIDEVVGQLVALAPLAGGRATWPLIVTGFVAFRVFDVWKPGLVGRAERSLPGGFGVVMDDVLAGVMAGLVVAACVLARVAVPA